MATAVEERRQKLVELNTRIREFEERTMADGYVPSAEEEQEHEALYNARADIRADLQRIGNMNARRQAAEAQGDIPDVVRREQAAAVREASRILFGERFTSSPEFQALLNAGIPQTNQSRIPQMPGFQAGGIMSLLGIRSDLITSGSNTSAGAFVTPGREAGYVDLGRRPLTVLDLIPIVRTNDNLIEFVRQTARTNNAAPVAEATDSSGSSGVKPESAFTFEVVQSAIKTIANWMPVTRQAVADVPQMRDIIDGELTGNVREELEDQVVAGDGTGQNFTGIANVSGVQAQAWNTDILTTTRKARTLVSTVGRRVPTAYVLHPLDWETIDLLQDNEARYFFGGPSVLGTPRLWGLPVVENEAVTQGVGYVGDWRRARIYDRQDTQIFVSDSHADFFIRNLLAILAEIRAGFAVLQPSAFVEIDLTA